MKMYLALFAAGILVLAYGCASTEPLNSRILSLEDRVGKLETAQPPSVEADMKKTQDAAFLAEAAAKRSEEAAVRSESAQKAAESAGKKAETAEKRSSKEFELMQKK